MRQGQLLEAAVLYQQSLDLLQDPAVAGQIISSAGTAYVGLGDLHREWNNLDEAIDYVEQGLTLGEQGDNSLIMIAGHITLANIQQAQGDPASTLKYIQQAVSVVETTSATWTWLTVPNVAALARLWIGQGQLAEAARLVNNF